MDKIFEFLKRRQVIIRKTGMLIGGAILIRQIMLLIINFKDKNNILHNPVTYIFAFGFILLALIMQIIAWKISMNLLNINISLLNALRGYMLSFLPKYIPGTIWGYLSRNEWLKRDFNIKTNIATIGSLIEIYLIFVSMVNLIIIYFSVLVSWWMIILLFLFSVFSFTILERVLRSKFIELKYGQLTFSLSFKYWLFALISEFLMWGFYGISVTFLISIFNFQIHNHLLNIFYSTTSYGFSWFIGFLVVLIPSGIGIREEIFANLMVYHLNLTYMNALSIGIITRIFISLGELLLAITGAVAKQYDKTI